MPKMDGAGPIGQGPMTGWGRNVPRVSKFKPPPEVKLP